MQRLVVGTQRVPIRRAGVQRPMRAHGAPVAHPPLKRFAKATLGNVQAGSGIFGGGKQTGQLLINRTRHVKPPWIALKSSIWYIFSREIDQTEDFNYSRRRM